mmetsp:Transcript_111904/g.316217  ORF Transcript_111904/g.316217 Transcript_111904/m.316217 type:complete len:166 (-) Transcript_111904:6-503(-)
MKRWWQNRCGFFDQGSLWRSMFELWHAEIPDFPPPDGRMFMHYSTARAHALALVVNSSALRSGASTFACMGKCWNMLQASGCLTEPWQLPHVLLVPVVPFLVGGRLMLPLQKFQGDAQWFCHFTTCTGDARGFQGKYAPLDPAMRCKHPRKPSFLCSCRKVIRPI